MAKNGPDIGKETRFQPGHPGGPGRPKGSRDKLSTEFIAALCKDFEAEGEAAIKNVREKDPGTYLRVIAAVVPKEVQFRDPLDGLTDEVLDAVIAKVRAGLEQPAQPTPQTMVN